MFGHLHVHTCYSVLDGMCKVDELVQTVKSLGQDFVAITDHGSTSALWEAQQVGIKHGIKIIHGTEFYYQRENDNGNGHLIALAKNNIGLQNIFKMQELAYVENFYYKPRITFDMLEKHGEGLILTSACLGSTVNQYIMDGNITEAREWLRKFQSTFKENFYVEIQPNQIPEQFTCNIELVKMAEQLDIPIVATNDVHYINESDSMPHEVLLALQLNKKMSDPKRWKFDAVDFWLRTKEEMVNGFEGLPPDVVQESLHNTAVIASKCDAKIETGKFLPPFYNKGKKTARQLLAKEIMDGAKEFGFASDTAYMRDVQNELNIIDEEGYCDYFLVVQDYIKSARANGVLVGDGRGSGCGSKVAFLTDITRVEPRKYNLLFERFMAHNRTPDKYLVV